MRGDRTTNATPTRERGSGQALILEVVALLVLVTWMYLNASVGAGGGLFANGGLFAAEPRPPSAGELLTHQRLTIAAVGLPVLVFCWAAWRRRWIPAAVQLPVIVLMLQLASVLSPQAP